MKYFIYEKSQSLEKDSKQKIFYFNYFLQQVLLQYQEYLHEHMRDDEKLPSQLNYLQIFSLLFTDRVRLLNYCHDYRQQERNRQEDENLLFIAQILRELVRDDSQNSFFKPVTVHELLFLTCCEYMSFNKDDPKLLFKSFNNFQGDYDGKIYELDLYGYIFHTFPLILSSKNDTLLEDIINKDYPADEITLALKNAVSQFLRCRENGKSVIDGLFKNPENELEYYVGSTKLWQIAANRYNIYNQSSLSNFILECTKKELSYYWSNYEKVMQKSFRKS